MRLQEGLVTLQLDVLGYQFPELVDQEWDSDWLMLRLQLQCGDQVWERTDPSITTFELQGLADWLSEVADHIEVFASWRHERLTTQMLFTEPNLGFKALNAHLNGAPVNLRVYLSAEYLPPFAELLPHHVGEDIDEIWVDFGVDRDDIYTLRGALAEALTEFPVRVGLSERTSSADSD